jgi:hypothetical protein
MEVTSRVMVLFWKILPNRIDDGILKVMDGSMDVHAFA